MLRVDCLNEGHYFGFGEKLSTAEYFCNKRSSNLIHFQLNYKPCSGQYFLGLLTFLAMPMPPYLNCSCSFTSSSLLSPSFSSSYFSSPPPSLPALALPPQVPGKFLRYLLVIVPQPTSPTWALASLNPFLSPSPVYPPLIYPSPFSPSGRLGLCLTFDSLFLLLLLFIFIFLLLLLVLNPLLLLLTSSTWDVSERAACNCTSPSLPCSCSAPTDIHCLAPPGNNVNIF